MEAEQEKQREDYNHKHANPSVYALGAKVLVKRQKREGKWTIVGFIMKNLGKGIYLIRDDATKAEQKVNGAHLKKY